MTLPGQTLGLAELFSDEARHRTQPNGKLYESVVRMTPDQMKISQGLRVRLTGRIDQVANGVPARCIQRAGSEQRPVCILAVKLNEVMIENSATGETIATWSTALETRGEP